MVQQSGNPPQPGQFVFSETKGPSGTISRMWRSAHGQQPGLTGTGADIPSGEARGIGYRPDVPTDPSQVRSYLENIGLLSGDASNNAIGKTVLFLLQSIYLRSTQLAALYEFLAGITGFTHDPHAVDAMGREGVGIRWYLPFDGGSTEIIFDPTTHAYLGVRTWPAASFKGPTSPYNGSALIRMAVVDRPGEVPSSS